MPSSKTSFAEIYAWNGVILSSVAIAWGLHVATFHGFVNPLTAIGSTVFGVGFLLLIMQSSAVRTFVDFTAPAFTAAKLPKRVRFAILKLWPMSILTRIFCHFFFTWWWLLMGISVLMDMSVIQDVRYTMYFGLAALHADRLVRIIQWMRK